jgi:sulfonate transport system substrate-binding protein
MSQVFNRRTALGALAALGSCAALTPLYAQNTKTVRIGFQKSSTLISVLKLQGTLEQRLAPLGFAPSWHEFTSGLPLLEALNLNNIDFSADVADTVPVFAQAAGAQLTFVAQEAPSPSAQAILVPKDSPIRSVAELKGKNIGFAKAAGVHYLLITALAKAGLSFSDIHAKYLTPADGRAAFEKGAIDAWVVWDPFLSAAQIQSGARVLADGEGLASYQRYYLASTRFADANPKVLDVIYAELEKAGRWVKSSPKDAAALLAPFWGLDPAIVERANSQRSYAVRAVTPERLVEQQRIADAFYAEKLLPKPVDALNVPLFKPSPATRGIRG